MRELDAAEMAALHEAAFVEARAWSEAEIADLLRTGRVRAVSRPDGFAMVQIIAPEAELLTIAVRPSAQGRGIGAALLRAAMADAAAAGASRMMLEVDCENVPARRLYEAAGFAVDGVRKSYYRHPDGHRSDALLLSCSLSA
jgi:ribosomal-protein-alanine N-acetyltransferase